VLGFQDIEGLHHDYGADEGDKLANLARNTTILKLTSPRTAKWGSERLGGEFERFEYLQTKGPTTSITEHLQKREAVMPSELLHLGDAVGGIVRGFHLIMGIPGIIEHAARLPLYSSAADFDYQPRPTAEQDLAEWTEADDKRFGIVANETKKPKAPGRLSAQTKSLSADDIEFFRGVSSDQVF